MNGRRRPWPGGHERKSMMKNIVYAFCLVSLISFAAGSARGAETAIQDSAWAQIDPQVFTGLTPEEVSKVKAGEIVILKEMGNEGADKTAFIRAVLFFRQPVEKTWALITKSERQIEYLDHIDETKSIVSDSTGNITEFHLSFGFIKVKYRVKHKYGLNHNMTWDLDPAFKNDVKELKGYWQFFRLDDNNCLARYGTRVKASPLIPTFVEEYMTKRDLPKALGNVKKWIESEGKFNRDEKAEEPKKKEKKEKELGF